MLLGEPPRSPYDFHFQVAGFPVRVHPFFWLLVGIIGFSGASSLEQDMRLISVLIFVASAFVSILIHEMGHAIMMRKYGSQARIVLYAMGGLAIPDSGNVWDTQWRHSQHRSPQQQIIISLAGPIAGFLFALVVVLILYAVGGRFFFHDSFPFYGFTLNTADPPHRSVPHMLIHDLLWINIFWGLMNLLPVYPLDGGQVAREVFTLQEPSQGIVKSLWLSVFVGGGVAAYCVFQSLQNETRGGLFMAFLFGSLAYSSYQTLQQYTGGGGSRW